MVFIRGKCRGDTHDVSILVLTMKKIFVCSQFSSHGLMVTNVKTARAICRKILLVEKHIPFAPHLFFPRFLNEWETTERKAGINAGLEFLPFCDELWYFTVKDFISKGMAIEIEAAEALEMTIVEHDAIEFING